MHACVHPCSQQMLRPQKKGDHANGQVCYINGGECFMEAWNILKQDVVLVQLQNQVVVHGTYAEAVCRRMAFIVEPLSLCHVSLFWDLVLYEITFIVITPGSSTFQHQPSLK